MKEDALAPEPWYNQPAMWVVMGVLAFTVVSSFALLYLASTNPPELLRTDNVTSEARKL